MGEEHTGPKVIGGYSLCLFWPAFFLGASFCNFENWMDDILSFLRFFLQIKIHSSDERSDGIFGFARRKTVGDHGRVPGVLGLLGPRAII